MQAWWNKKKYSSDEQQKEPRRQRGVSIITEFSKTRMWLWIAVELPLGHRDVMLSHYLSIS